MADRNTKAADPVTAYARDVAAGKIIAGPHVRAACKRHLGDLKDGKARGLRWDPVALERVFGFFRDVLRLNGGEHEGKPFVLEPWQEFVVGSLFGWKGKDGHRRFRMAFVLTGKGSGKSPLAAGIGLYCLTADGEPRAEVYAAAAKKDQAQILFRDAAAMVRQSPPLTKKLEFSGGQGKEWNIAYLPQGSFFRTIASDSHQSGPRPHCALLDEVHEHHDANMIEMLRAGTKGRRQALILMITNAPADRTGVCYQYSDYAAKVSAGDIEDDSFFGFVCGIDDGDDPFKSEDCWIKANPSLGVTFGPKYLREQVTQALGMPAKEGVVKRLNFCLPTDTVTEWISRDLWDGCETLFDPAELLGKPCWLGLDLSAKRDLTALGAVWRDGERTYIASWFWTPGDTLDERARDDNVPYRSWVNEGFLFAPAGRIIDKTYVAQFVQQLCAEHDVQALAFDQAQIEDFLAGCDDVGLDARIDDGKEGRGRAVGLRMLRHGQGFQGFNAQDRVLWMPQSISELERLVVTGAGRVGEPGNTRIRKNPVLRWNSASAVLQPDPSGNRKWDKRKSTGRIDGIVAITMAVGAAFRRDGATVSVYESRGLRFV